jgi:predicted Rossmann fold flavoprotein
VRHWGGAMAKWAGMESRQTSLGARPYDVIVIGGGASGLLAAICAGRQGQRVLVCERSPSPGRKILASGGQRCNLSNTLSSDEFMGRVKPHGRFMGPALSQLGGPKLREFFREIGLETVVHDGFRVWPERRKSSDVLAALVQELERLQFEVKTDCHIDDARFEDELFHVQHQDGVLHSSYLILATGGLALPGSGSDGQGYGFAETFGHKCTTRYPAGVPLVTAEDWPAKCTAHTIGKARVTIDLPKCGKLAAIGDLIFTRNGIRGPVVLDISREISPLLEKHTQVPLLFNLCKGRNQEEWQELFKSWHKDGSQRLVDCLEKELPLELAEVMCELGQLDGSTRLSQLGGKERERLIQVLIKTPLTVTGTTGYKGAFITRGGVKLKEVRPETMESKLQKGLFIVGEVLDMDGPCGGFNLQWAFASGWLAAMSTA